MTLAGGRGVRLADGLLPGEDPVARSSAEARRWLEAYDQLLQDTHADGADGPVSGPLLEARRRHYRTRISFWRQQELIKNGWTSQAKFDQAKQKLDTTQGQIDATQATLRTAQEAAARRRGLAEDIEAAARLVQLLDAA